MWHVEKPLPTTDILFEQHYRMIRGFPSGSDGKESTCNAEDLALIPELGRCPGEGNGNPLQYSEEPGGLQSMGFERVGHN